MLGRDAFAPVDHAHADHVRTRAFEPHCHILAVATIFEGVDDEVLDQLQELRAVAGDDGFAIVLFDNDSALLALDQLLAAHFHLLDEGRRGTGSRGTLNRSASIREREMRSSTSCCMRRASSSMILRNRLRVAGSLAGSSSCRVSDNPISVASGVLSSWLALATKSTRSC